MTGLIEAASAIMSGAERRLEIIGQNTANLSTPGYNRLVAFESLLVDRASNDPPTLAALADLSRGELKSTANPLDFALSGDGYFLVRAGDRLLPTRAGAFSRDADGRLVNAAGHALQQSGGGDLQVDGEGFGVLLDGTMLAEGQPIARIGVFHLSESEVREALAAGGLVDLPREEIAEASVRQGMIETSNVALGDEMIAMMASARRAEGGARLVQVYDELMGRVITSLGQGGR